MKGARITTTLRFQINSSALDARAVRDIDRLADFLRSPDIRDRKVLIAGFADAVGSHDTNRALSLSRARSVATLLDAKGVKATEVAGYGAVAPVACSTDEINRNKNRRVEVWVY